MGSNQEGADAAPKVIDLRLLDQILKRDSIRRETITALVRADYAFSPH